MRGATLAQRIKRNKQRIFHKTAIYAQCKPALTRTVDRLEHEATGLHFFLRGFRNRWTLYPSLIGFAVLNLHELLPDREHNVIHLSL